LFFGPVSTGSLDYVTLEYAGGQTSIEGGFGTFNPIEIYQAERARRRQYPAKTMPAGGGGDRKRPTIERRLRDLHSRARSRSS